MDDLSLKLKIMKQFLAFLLLAIILTSCELKISNENEVRLTKIPIYIENEKFQFLKDTFNFDQVDRANLFLGSLSPQYPMAFGINNSRSVPALFNNGCLQASAYSIIIKDSLGFQVINSINGLKKYFAPIESKEEAISYAYAYSGLKPMYEFDIKPNYRTFTKKINTTYSIEADEGYELNLFGYQLCGCGPHTHFMVKFLVKKNGDINEVETIKLFENPEEDGLCVD